MVTHYEFIQTKLNPYNDFQIKKASYANTVYGKTFEGENFRSSSPNRECFTTNS